MMRRKEYISPRLISVAFKVEQGFDGSQTKALGLYTDKGDQYIEGRDNSGNILWGNSNDWHVTQQ